MTPEKWEVADTHRATGWRAMIRTIGFTHTGNNEGTLTREVQVLERDGNAILTTRMEIEWAYHGEIKAGFSDDGLSLTITGSDGQRKVRTLPEPA